MKHFSTVCLQASPVSDLLKQLNNYSRYLQEIEQELKTFLPTPLKNHVGVANIREGVLILHADTSVWAARTHFFQGRIIKFFAQETRTVSVKKVQVKVCPPYSSKHAVQALPSMSKTPAKVI